MRRFGFSTGALAKGDYREGLRLQTNLTDAVEVSALREEELEPLLSALPTLGLERFGYVSFHAPSRLQAMQEETLVDLLARSLPHVHTIVVHPDVITNPGVWRSLANRLAIENMDQRKACGRTVDELRPYFNDLPEARFCCDLGHARQIDPTMGLALELLRAYGDRLVEIHLSEVDADSRHVAISLAAMKSFRRLSRRIPDDVCVIIESVIAPDAMLDELNVARAALDNLLDNLTVAP